MMKILRKKRKGGFTLIELIVVIAIIGILLVIAIPRLTGFTDVADARAAEATARTLNTATAVYLAADSTRTVAADKAAMLLILEADLVDPVINIDDVDFDNTATSNWWSSNL